MLEGYISREAAVKAANEWVSEACMAPVMRVSRLFDKLAKVPAADVAEVVHGEWETNSDRPDSLICSVCKCGFDMWKHDPHNYCPNCGARMDGWMEDADNG